MRVHIELASPRHGDWYLVSEGTYLVGFSGLHAHEMAMRQQRELTELLNAAAVSPDSADHSPSSTLSDD
jgi:hypothetical protein